MYNMGGVWGPLFFFEIFQIPHLQISYEVL